MRPHDARRAASAVREARHAAETAHAPRAAVRAPARALPPAVRQTETTNVIPSFTEPTAIVVAVRTNLVMILLFL